MSLATLRTLQGWSSACYRIGHFALMRTEAGWENTRNVHKLDSSIIFDVNYMLTILSELIGVINLRSLYMKIRSTNIADSYFFYM